MITVKVSGLERWLDACKNAPVQARDAMMHAVNDTGDRARTQVVRSLAKQMGLPYGTVREKLRTRVANKSALLYQLETTGGFMSLRSFDPQERKRGVSARPWGTRRVFRSTFIVRSLGGQVFRRTTSARFPIQKLWGPAMPVEMLRDNVPKDWETAVQVHLPARLAHHLNRLLKSGGKTPSVAPV